jgi:heterodisulfide reductase subunit A
MTSLIINGQPVQAASGATLLRVLEKQGIRVPTLCDHKALTPYGACRLCVVEVKPPGRAATLQASCSAPALDGMEVTTDSERVKRARRVVAELLLARCPDSEAIRRVAAEQGVTETRFVKKNDDCVYCGLCVRMCKERMGRSAIGFSGRGPRKKLQAPFGKHNEACWTCGACDLVCPVGKKVSALTTARPFEPLRNDYNLGLDGRAAISILYPQAVPNKAAIDAEACLHLTRDVCGVCQEVCEAKAIDFEQKERRIDLEVGAVVLSPGYRQFDAAARPGAPRPTDAYGYGRFPNVVSALEFERILSASGPYLGHVGRPSDRKKPGRVAFIQCVGSRDAERDYCSSICCMYATKEAIIAKEHAGAELETDVYFMDLRAFSKGFEEYYLRAKALGVRYLRSRPLRVDEKPGTHDLVLTYLSEDERKTTQEYDLVVLAAGVQPPAGARELAEKLGIALTPEGFCRTSVFAPLDSSREGVFVAGPFTEPKDIPETVMQASGAASQALALLREARGTLLTPRVYPPELDFTGQEPRLGVFVCHCGTNIAGVVSVPEVVEYARTLPGVVYAENNLYTCSNDTQERIKQKIAEHRLNRVIVASCTPRTHEPLFRNTLREAGVNPYLFEMANIRDQCSWVHMHEAERATRKAKDLVRIAVAKSRLAEPLQKRSVPVNKAALVVGGGLAGMTASLGFAGQGYDVHLVEREEELGGNLRHVRYLLDGENPQRELERIVGLVRSDPRVRVHTGSRVVCIVGSIGAFTTRLGTPRGVEEVRHGVVVVATGAAEHRPTEYLYGSDPDVLTQRELERRLASPNDFRTAAGAAPATVVMIQCVGSRDEEHPYCSRVCCTEAIKNALRVKTVSPGTAVYVLYRDIRTYGFKERYYTLARQRGVVFARWDADRKPEVARGKGGLEVTFLDQTLRTPIVVSADLVVLSAGIRAHADAKELAQHLKVPLNRDGFFLEAHMKLRPVDFATEGVFLAGLAHAPKTIEESIIQAQAAAARAASVLSQDALEMEANVSQVVDAACDGCAYCVDTCPYHAITLLEYMSGGAVKKIVETDETACKGCGCCQATCPKDAVFVRGFRLQQISAQVNAALEVV